VVAVLSAVATYSDGSTGDFTPACEAWWPANPEFAIPTYESAIPNDVVGIAASACARRG